MLTVRGRERTVWDTPLHLAVGTATWPATAMESVVKMLVAAGSDVNAANERGETPAAVLAVLIEAGADLEARAMYGRGHVLRGLTPMYLAALGNGNPEVIAVPAEAGADRDER